MNNQEKKEISILKQICNEKTIFCNHEGSCLMNALKGLIKSFGLGFAIKSVVHILTSLLRKKSNLLHGFFEKDFYYLSLFFCTQTCLLKSIQCLLRRLRNKESGFNAFFSGFLSSLVSMYFYQKKTNLYNWRMLAYMRVIEGFYYSLVNRGYIRKKALHYSVMYAVGSVLLSYSVFCESQIALPDVIKLYSTFEYLTPDEKIAQYLFIEKNEKLLSEKGIF